jgi:hypothetical protein
MLPDIAFAGTLTRMSLRDRLGTHVTQRLCAYTLLLVAAFAGRALTAQSPSRTITLGISAGLAVHSGPSHLSRLGPAASAFAAWPTTARLALSLEGLVSTFSKSSSVVEAPCPPQPTPTPCVSSSGRLTVGALVAAMRWNDSTVAAGKGGSYLILGGGFYRALDHATAPGATRLGWTAGFGFLLSRTAPRLALEVRYHQIPRWPNDRLSVIPIALAISW